MMPSMDLEILGSSIELCDFDIFKTRRKRINGVCEKSKEFTPMNIDLDKLKAYVVPYMNVL